MAYQKHHFVPGHVLKASEMNEIEDGIQQVEQQIPQSVVNRVNGQTGDVTLPIPSKTSELTNDSGFITNAVADLVNYYLKSETYTREEINQRISEIPKFAISVVSTLPTANISETTIYLVGGGDSGDLYTEYIHVNGAWELLGKQQLDLTGYATETWVIEQLGNYLKASELATAINTALAQAAASGEFDGTDGVGVSSVKQTTASSADGGNNVVTVTLTNGTTSTFTVKNGSTGATGAAGKTPVKGTDYWTEAERQQMVNDVIAALPDASEVSY